MCVCPCCCFSLRLGPLCFVFVCLSVSLSSLLFVCPLLVPRLIRTQGALLATLWFPLRGEGGAEEKYEATRILFRTAVGFQSVPPWFCLEVSSSTVLAQDHCYSESFCIYYYSQ